MLRLNLANFVSYKCKATTEVARCCCRGGRRQPVWACASIPCASLPTVGKCPPFDCPEATGATTSQSSLDHSMGNMSKRLVQIKPTKLCAESFAIAGCQESTNKPTCNGKSSTCGSSSQTIQSSRTLAPGSISSVQACKPFFDSQCLDKSTKLWLPTETALRELPVISLNGSSSPVGPNSWCCIRQQTQASKATSRKTSWPSSMSSVAVQTVDANTTKKKKPAATHTRKVRFYPAKEDKQKLVKWMGCHRLVYNRALAFAKKTGRLDFTEMGKRFVASRNIQEEWLRECPQVIRSAAIRELKHAYASNFAKKKLNASHKFDIKFKRKKDPLTGIRIELKNAAVKVTGDGQHISFFPKSLGPMRFDRRALEGISMMHDVVITKDKLGRFTMHVPYHRENQPTKEATAWCAIDPGVRTFGTVYSTHQVVTIGEGAAARIARLCMHMDQLISKASKANGLRRKRRMHLAVERMRLRIRHLVAEMHWQAAAFLTSEFTDILLPEFETKQMTRRTSRKLSSKSARSMFTLAHYTFRQRLQHKAAGAGCRVHLCDESYTSKTCTRCGYLHHKLGASKTFACPVCNVRIDRDIAGARNIFIKCGP